METASVIHQTTIQLATAKTLSARGEISEAGNAITTAQSNGPATKPNFLILPPAISRQVYHLFATGEKASQPFGQRESDNPYRPLRLYTSKFFKFAENIHL